MYISFPWELKKIPNPIGQLIDYITIPAACSIVTQMGGGTTNVRCIRHKLIIIIII
jgi:hypothetical protein